MFTLGVNISRPPKTAGSPRQYWVSAGLGKNRPLILRRGTEKTADFQISPLWPFGPGGAAPGGAPVP